ncbi:MAG: c-type cytochrome [Acidobacteria bacterium]|nr:c-type cytochrome [Acidobacteriota bacterium]
MPQPHRSRPSLSRLLLWAAALGLAHASLARAQAPPAQDHPGVYSAADIEAGSRLYAKECALCHGPNGDGITGVDLRRGQFRRFMADEDIAGAILTGVPGAGMPSFGFQPAEVNSLIAFIRAGFDLSGTAVRVGQAPRGKTVFEGKGKCASCHRVNGQGPRVAPDLSDVGAVRSPSALQRTLVDPTSAMLPINRPVTVVTRDGRTIRGRRLNEDTFSVQIIDEQEKLVSLIKADLKSYTLGKTSPMPPAGSALSGDDIADLVAYLLTLKGL